MWNNILYEDWLDYNVSDNECNKKPANPWDYLLIPKELVDEEHPLCYKPFHQYLHFFLQRENPITQCYTCFHSFLIYEF